MSQAKNIRTSNASISISIAALTCFAVASALYAQPQVGPQVRVDVGGGTEAANETSIASSSFNPDEIVATWNDWRRSTSSEIINMGVAVSLDGGDTWNDFLVRPPVANQSTVEGDPMTAYDPRTGTLWVGAISFAGNGGLYVAKKNPGSGSFETSVQVGQLFFADKCWMAAGPRPGNPNATNVYIAYNEGVWRSTDMGSSWQGPVSVPSGIGFLPRVGPNGEVYVSYWDFGNGHWLIRSFDGGQSFGSPIRIATRLDVWGTQDGSRFPGLFRCPSLNTLAVDMNDGTLYAVYPDTTDIVGGNRNVDLYFTKSTDQGQTWSTPVVINADGDPPGDQFFPWLEVDDNGVLHMVFYDGRNQLADDNDPDGFFDAYYMYSDDGGNSWSEARLTPAPFNSIDDGLNRGSSQFIGDYSGLAFGGNKVYPCYLSNQNGDSDIFVHSITTDAPPGIQLGNPVPGLVNQSNSLTATNGDANRTMTFIYGFNQGSVNVPGCPGLTVDIQSPQVLGRRMTDGSGTATLNFFVPQAASGVTVLFQAGQRSNCTKSNLVEFTF